MSNREKKERVDFTIRQMGLQESTDTRIKGKGSKGLSEGQKRRLAICIEILTSPKLLLLDEPTSGLDSAASYYVMSRIASLKIRDGIERTIVASISLVVKFLSYLIIFVFCLQAKQYILAPLLLQPRLVAELVINVVYN